MNSYLLKCEKHSHQYHVNNLLKSTKCLQIVEEFSTEKKKNNLANIHKMTFKISTNISNHFNN